MTALAASGPAIIIPRRAQPKSLKILDVTGFYPPAYEEWRSQFEKEWGERNNTRVILDRLIYAELASRENTEAAEQRGHDLVNTALISDATIYEDAMIDLRDIYEECEHCYSKPVDLAIKTSYNPTRGEENLPEMAGAG